MKLFLRLLCVVGLGIGPSLAFAQTCTSTSLNWDYLSFLDAGRYTSLNTTSTTFQNQTFAFGKNTITATHNFSAANTAGDNSAHTGETGSYGAGDDVQFTGDGFVTFTFKTAVQNVKFSLYDIDYNQKVTVTALNAGVAQVVTLSKVSGTNLTLNSTVTTAPTATSGATNAIDVASSDGTVNVDIAGPITSFTITTSQTATKTTGPAAGREDGSFWISDIQACSSTASFPNNYQQTGSNQPFTNQPDYFLTTPDNNSVYMVDPATGKAWHVFTETGATYINSFGYDPYSRTLYYVIDGSSTTNAPNNKKIKKYSFDTETSSDFIPDITALGIPTFDQGVESAAASFYDGALYLGVEGGIPSGSSNRESIIWRIDIDATTGIPATKAYQVYGVPSAGHDWGDFGVKDGVLYDFNTAASTSQFKHFNLTTQATVNYSTVTAGQTAITWSGDIYAVRNVVEKYNLDGTKGAAKTITVVSGPAWVGNAGDASEAFKPKMDFGDAPSTYDPITLSPAVHEMDSTLKLGTKLDREWSKVSSTAADGDGTDEDGLTYVRIMNLNGGKYQTDVNVYNHTGSNATVCAWVDFNANGTFEAGEGVTQTVASSTAQQTVSLYWTGITTNLPANSYTYLRIRITSAANAMTTTNATGYFSNGEVEDYYVIVNTTPLAINNLEFNALVIDQKVKLSWSNDEDDVVKYSVYRSLDGTNWKNIAEENANGLKSFYKYDLQPVQGKSMYQLKVTHQNGLVSLSEIKTILFDYVPVQMTILSNPSINNIGANISSSTNGKAVISLFDSNGILIIKKEIFLQKGENTLSIPVSKVATGNYVLQLQKDHQLKQQKIIVIN